MDSCELVEVTAADRAAATVRGGVRLRTRRGYPLSCALRMTAPSEEGAKGNFASAEARFRACGHDQRALRSPFGNLRPPLISLRQLKRWQVAAALSAAVTTPKPIGDYTKLTGGTNSEESRTPNASYSSGGGPGEGLLLEKPPPPEFPPYLNLT